MSGLGPRKGLPKHPLSSLIISCNLFIFPLVSFVNEKLIKKLIIVFLPILKFRIIRCLLYFTTSNMVSKRSKDETLGKPEQRQPPPPWKCYSTSFRRHQQSRWGYPRVSHAAQWWKPAAHASTNCLHAVTARRVPSSSAIQHLQCSTGPLPPIFPSPATILFWSAAPPTTTVALGLWTVIVSRTTVF